MDPAFPFVLSGEPELLALAYAADRGEALAAFYDACGQGRPYLVRGLTYLFELTLADIRNGVDRVLSLAWQDVRQAGHLEILRWLLDRYGLAAISCPGNVSHFLRTACAGGHLELVRWIVASLGPVISGARADINEALFRACANGHFGLARWLAVHFAPTWDAKARNNYALRCARGNECLWGVQWLIACFGIALTDIQDVHHWILEDGDVPMQPGLKRWLLERFGRPGAALTPETHDEVI